ncbi:hypothetical protein NUSPORA_02735 [Nucleospora cyclopteri]
MKIEKIPNEESSDSLGDFNEETIINNTEIPEIRIQTFQDFNLNEILLLNIRNAQFENPSPVQGISIPKVLLKRDILCQAKSGTGKTAVFVIGTIENYLRGINTNNNNTINTIVCCPTEELSHQIFLEYKRFCKNLKIRVSTDSTETDFFIGTPETFFSDPLLMHKINTINTLVVDECDLVVNNRHFQKFLKTAVERNKHFNILMFTATLTKETKRNCLSLLNDPFEIYVDDDTKLTLYGLKQFYVETKESDKISVLNKILQKGKKTIIFCRRTQNAKYIPTAIRNAQFLTSYESPRRRIRVLNDFRRGVFTILSTTDILSRGIDVSEVDLIVNYDIPETPQDYLHRVGRAGRFETEGIAINFVNGVADKMRLNEIKMRYEIDIKEYKL